MKMSRYTKNYIHEFLLEIEDKREIMMSFKKRVKTKSKSMNDYIELTNYERSVLSYDPSYKDLIEEVKYIPVGTIEYWPLLSSKCQNHLNNYFYKKYKNDYQNDLAALEIFSPEEISYIETKLERIKNFAVEHDLECLDYDGNLEPGYLADVFYKNRLIDINKLKLEIIVYSIKEQNFEYIDLDNDGNVFVTEKALKEFIDDLKVIPLTTDEKLRVSVSRTYTKFKEYALCNASKFKYFVTLTFADKTEEEKHKLLNENRNKELNEYDLEFQYVDDPSNYDLCVKCMTAFLNKLKKYLQRNNLDLYYLGVPEYHKNGNIHYHFLMSDIPSKYIVKCPNWLDRDYKTNKVNGSNLLTLWNHGKSDITLIQSKARVSTYISKYMIKSLNEINETDYLNRLNKKRYYNSNNLDIPVINIGPEDEINDYISSYSFTKHSYYDNTKIEKILYQIKEI